MTKEEWDKLPNLVRNIWWLVTEFDKREPTPELLDLVRRYGDERISSR